MRYLLIVGLLTLTSHANAKLNVGALQRRVTELRTTNTQLENAPPAQQQQLAEQRGRIVG